MSETDDLRKLLATSIAEEIKESVIDDFPKDIQEYLKTGFQQVTQEAMRFRSTLTNETDRGCALISASFLDYRLEKLIRSYLINDEKILDNMFSYSGALGTFSSRIDMAYLLGLIGKKVNRDLHIIRKIRNEFGHNPEPISFETQSVQNRCLELYNNYFNYKVSPRQNFIRVVCGIFGCIEGKIVNIKRITTEKDIEIDEEMKEVNTQFAELILNNVLNKVLDKEN